MPSRPPHERAPDEAREQLADLFGAGPRAFVVHYALQQQFGRGPAVQSLPVAAIAVRNLGSGEEQAFSIHDEARRADVDLDALAPDVLSRLEYALLFRFNDFLIGNRGARYLHWYMRDEKFGFAALESRFRRVLASLNAALYGVRSIEAAAPFLVAPGGSPYPAVVPEADKVDLARLLHEIYGIDRIGLRAIAERNGLAASEVMPGEDEPGAFERGNHARLEWSTTSKVRLIARIASLAHDDRLVMQPLHLLPRPSGNRVFINYRREDSAGTAGRLHDRLVPAFGAGHVFIDVVDLAAGENFEDALKRELEACDVLLAVIGRHWATATDTSGQLRLHRPEDLVRAEIVAALARGIPVIPVLVDGARMPTEQQLPPDLRPLLRHQAFELRHDRFQRDVEEFIEQIRTALQRAAQRGARR